MKWLLTAILLAFPVHAFSQPSLPVSKVEGQKGKLWKKDPFSPSSAQASQFAEAEMDVSPVLSLSTILFSDERSSAVINGRIYRIGDDITGQKIIDIKRTHVILGRGNKTYRLELKK